MCNKYLIIISLIIISNSILSQENSANQWYFGEYCGVDFSYGVPHGVTGGQITGWEGCATVGDMQGNLLFYTDGQVVYNKNHDVMENGTGLMGHWSSVHSSIIVRKPGSSNLFYIFTTDDSAIQHLENGWRYSMVDMSLNGGLGAVTETKNVLLEEMVSEKQVAIMHGNNSNVWIVAHRWNSNEFVAYEISSVGISEDPVVSAIGTVHEGGYSPNPEYDGWTNACGQMKASPSGDKIALAIQTMGIYELFDFDQNTGLLSNCNTSSAYSSAYGIEFSPDGSKLYVTNNIYESSILLQYDITENEPLSNPVLIAIEGIQNRGLQLGPNGKIYATRYLGEYIAEISNPNAEGTACNYNPDAIYLEGNYCHACFPSIFYYKGFEFVTGSEVNQIICEGDSIFLQNAYQSNEGIYYDTITSSLGWDSIINTHLTVLPAPPIPNIYEEDGILYCSFAENYQWYRNSSPIAGATSQVYQPFISGNYTVETFNNSSCHIFSEGFEFIYYNINTKSVNIKIYPNPIYSTFSIFTPYVYSISIFSLNGQKMYNKNNLLKLSEHDISFLEKGFYIIEIKTANETSYKRIVKE